MSRVLASTAFIDHVKGHVIIDGVEIPFWMDSTGPVVEQMGFEGVAVVSLPVLVAGTVVQRFQDRRQVHDVMFGDVGEYARRYVREGLLAAFPWLEVDDDE